MTKPQDPRPPQGSEDSEFSGNDLPSKPADATVPPPEPRQIPITGGPEPDEPEDPSETPPPPAQN